MWMRKSAVALMIVAMSANTAVPEQVQVGARAEAVYSGVTGDQLGIFIDDAWFDADRSGGVGTYGLQNTQWPDFWIHGLNVSYGYRTTGDYPANPDLRNIVDAGTPVGNALWTICYYTGGDGPHPDLAGSSGAFPNVYPTQEDRQGAGNPFDPATDNPYMSVAWGSLGEPTFTEVEYDHNGVREGEPGHDPATAGFDSGGFTVLEDVEVLLNVDSGGVWDWGPGGTLYDWTTVIGKGWGPVFRVGTELYCDPLNISGLFGGNDPYGNPYVWTETKGAYNDVSIYWYQAPGMLASFEAVPEPATFVLAAFGLLGLVALIRRRRATA